MRMLKWGKKGSRKTAKSLWLWGDAKLEWVEPWAHWSASTCSEPGDGWEDVLMTLSSSAVLWYYSVLLWMGTGNFCINATGNRNLVTHWWPRQSPNENFRTFFWSVLYLTKKSNTLGLHAKDIQHYKQLTVQIRRLIRLGLGKFVCVSCSLLYLIRHKYKSIYLQSEVNPMCSVKGYDISGKA